MLTVFWVVFVALVLLTLVGLRRHVKRKSEHSSDRGRHRRTGRHA